MGMFIVIDIDHGRLTTGQARRLVPLCPVDVFAMEGTRLKINPDQADECILCELCLEATPPGAITINKTYKNEKLTSRASD